MAVSFGTFASAASASASFAVNKPTSTVTDDFLIAFLFSDDGTNGISGGATWGTLTSGTVSGLRYLVAYKVAGASEPTTYTVTQSGGNGSGTHVTVIRAPGGTGTPIFAVTTGQSGTSISTPSVTPQGSADLLIRAAAGVQGISAVAWAAPGGTTKRSDQQSGNGTAGATATAQLASGAATGAASFTASNSVAPAMGITVTITGSSPQTVSPSGIATGETFGTAQLNLTIGVPGVTSGEAFGGLIISTPQPQTVSLSGIASGEAFGTLTTKLYLGPSGVATGEAFGAARLAALIGPTGIASAEAFGLTNVAIEQFITPSGAVSAESFGTLTLQLGYPQTIGPEGIESGELVEDPFVRNDDRLVLVNPSIQETPAAWDPLNIRFGIHRGITIMRDEGGTWRLVRYPSQTELEVAQRFYLGGRRHVISVDEANDLISAGYGAYIILERDD